MPIYEYRCDACGHTLDALQKISDEPLRDCPSCDASALRRLMSAPSFRLKGGGWYETDFKSEKERKRNLVDDSDGKPKEKSKEKDDKPAAADSKKSETKTGSDQKGASGSKASSDAVA